MSKKLPSLLFCSEHNWVTKILILAASKWQKEYAIEAWWVVALKDDFAAIGNFLEIERFFSLESLEQKASENTQLQEILQQNFEYGFNYSERPICAQLNYEIKAPKKFGFRQNEFGEPFYENFWDKFIACGVRSSAHSPFHYYNLFLLSQKGAQKPFLSLENFPSPPSNDVVKVPALFDEYFVLTIHVGQNSLYKRWNLEFINELFHQLGLLNLKIKMILIGDLLEKEFDFKFGNHTNFINLISQTNSSEQLEILNRSHLLICSNLNVAYEAAMIQTPSILLSEDRNAIINYGLFLPYSYNLIKNTQSHGLSLASEAQSFARSVWGLIPFLSPVRTEHAVLEDLIQKEFGNFSLWTHQNVAGWIMFDSNQINSRQLTALDPEDHQKEARQFLKTEWLSLFNRNLLSALVFKWGLVNPHFFFNPLLEAPHHIDLEPLLNQMLDTFESFQKVNNLALKAVEEKHIGLLSKTLALYEQFYEVDNVFGYLSRNLKLMIQEADQGNPQLRLSNYESALLCLKIQLQDIHKVFWHWLRELRGEFDQLPEKEIY